MPPGLEIKRLVKVYIQRGRTKSLGHTGLNLSEVFIPFGKVTAVLGRSGSGKSTLLNIISLIMAPNGHNGALDKLRSDIRFEFPFAIEGFDSSKFTLEECWQRPNLRQMLLRNYFGFVFQDSMLFPGLTVQQNLQLPTLASGLPRSGFDNLWSHSLTSGLFDELAESGENGNGKPHLEDVLPPRAREGVSAHSRGADTPDRYSGGQLQRFALMRSLLHDPKVVFADEPTGNLDPKTADKVFKCLKGWQREVKDRTLILVTHDIELARNYADRILIIDESHEIRGDATFDAVENDESPESRWGVDRDQMTDQLSHGDVDNGKPNPSKRKKMAGFDGVALHSQSMSRPRSKRTPIARNIRFAWFFSRWDIWPKTPSLKWTTVVGLLVTSILALTSFIVLGFYRGSSQYMEIIQSNPFIHSLNISRPLTDAAIDLKTLRQIGRTTVKHENGQTFYLYDDDEIGTEKVFSNVSGFNRRSLWGTLTNPGLEADEAVRLRGRTIDPNDPVMEIVSDNIIAGNSFGDKRDLGLILSLNAMAKLGMSEIPTERPQTLYSKHGSGVEERIRMYPILGIARQLPEPGGDFLMTNHFYAQLVNHYFAPTHISYFEVGPFPELTSAETTLKSIRPKMKQYGVFGSTYVKDRQAILKLTYRYGDEVHEDVATQHYQEIFQAQNENLFGLMPFERSARSVSKEDTTQFTYGSLYIKEFKHAAGVRSFLQEQFKIDMNLGMIESLDTISSMRSIVSGIVYGLLFCLGVTGVFVIYSVFSQLANRSSRQFGVLKTMGIDHKALGLVHLFQLLVIFSFSTCLGLLLALVLGNFLDNKLHLFLQAGIGEHPFFVLSLEPVILVALVMLMVYTLAATLAVKNVYLRSAIELIKDQREFKFDTEDKLNRVINWNRVDIDVND